MYLIKNKAGFYLPAYISDQEESDKIAVGTFIKGTAPRNYKFHKKAFVLLQIGSDNQTNFTSFEVYRKVMTIMAGYYDEAPTKTGGTYYIPQSLSYDSMSAEKFNKWYIDVLNVIAGQMETKSETINNEVENALRKIEKFY